MRIGSGRLRGRRLTAPAGRATRPTSGRLRKSLFDVLAPELDEARVLDLFAGAGSLGIEALSRGAARAVFVDRGREAAAAIEENLESLGLAGQGRVLRREVGLALGALAAAGERFDVVFVDPPYGAPVYEAVLERLAALGLVRPGGVVVVEHHHKTPLAERYGPLRRSREVRAGESRLSFYRAEEEATGRGPTTAR